MRVKSFSEEELKEALDSGLTYKEAAIKFGCTISLISIRACEYNLSTYSKYAGTKNYNGQISIDSIIRVKGKLKFKCYCLCGNVFDARPTDIIHKQIKSCGCLKPRVNGRLTKSVISKIRNKSNYRNIEFSVTLEYLQSVYDSQNGKCVYSDIELTFPKSARDTDFTASLDRIDSSKGYIDGNVQWLDKRVNSMKNDMTEQQFLELCHKISGYSR